MALFVASFFVIVGAMVSLYHESVPPGLAVDVACVSGIVGTILSGLLALVASLSGTCNHPVGSVENGEIYEIQVCRHPLKSPKRLCCSPLTFFLCLIGLPEFGFGKT